MLLLTSHPVSKFFFPPPPDTFGLIVIASVTRLVGNAFLGIGYLFKLQNRAFSKINQFNTENSDRLENFFHELGHSKSDSLLDDILLLSSGELEEFFKEFGDINFPKIIFPAQYLLSRELEVIFEEIGLSLITQARIWFYEAKVENRLNIDNISALIEGAIGLIPWIGPSVSILATIGEKQSFTEGAIEFGIDRLSGAIGDWLGRLAGHLVSKAGQTDEFIEAALEQTKLAAKEQRVLLDVLSDQVFVDAVKTPAGWVTEQIVATFSGDQTKEFMKYMIENSGTGTPIDSTARKRARHGPYRRLPQSSTLTPTKPGSRPGSSARSRSTSDAARRTTPENRPPPPSGGRSRRRRRGRPSR